MGAHIARCRARALHDSNGWPLSLELSMVAILSSDPCGLRGGSAADGIAANDRSYDGVYPDRFDGNRSVYLPDGWSLRCCRWLDFSWIERRLVVVGIAWTRFHIFALAAGSNHILRVSCDISLPADKLRSSKIQFHR